MDTPIPPFLILWLFVHMGYYLCTPLTLTYLTFTVYTRVTVPTPRGSLLIPSVHLQVMAC